MRSLRLSRLLAWSLPVVVLLLLAWAGIEAGDPGECLDGTWWVTPGEPVQLTVETPTWLRFGTNEAHAYRADVSGPTGSTLELWSTWSESGTCWTFSDQLVEQRVSTGEPESFEWGATWDPAALWLSPPEGAASASFEVALTELAAPPDPLPLVIPAAAHRAGVKDAFFQTDLELLNLCRCPAELELVFVPEAGGEELSSSLTLEPQQLLTLDDLVLEVFGLEDARGAVLVSSEYRLLTLSRTYTDAAGGTFGQRVPAERWDRSAGAGPGQEGRLRTLLHLAGGPDYRSNVGFVEVLGLDASVELELHDGEGTPVASGTVTVPARSFLQIDDVFAYLGAEPLPHASMRVTVTNAARVLSYASVVDNRTSDPLYLPGLADADASDRLIVPAVASTAGAHGTRWRSDLWVQAKGPATTLEVTFTPSDGSQPTVATFPIPSSGVLALEDVVGLLGAHGSGALRLGADADLLATSRTYNLTTDGTYGQLIPAESWPYYSEFRTSTLLGVEGSEERRTNIGMVNPSNSELDLALRLVSGEGVLLGSRSYQLGPRRHLQVNDVFATLHVPGQANCRVDLEVDGGQSYHGVLAYASVVDNRSGDPMYVPAVNTWGELEIDVELDNRQNAVLVDQLPQAVGLNPLPAGTLTATVSGSGNLGRPDLPIQVLCLYKDPAGLLRSAILPIGGSVTGVAGGERLWCVIPDWMSIADNTGSVTVSLTGGEEDASLTLDARTNAVAFDRLEGPVVWARPSAESLQVLTTGDLGRPELEPQVLSMYREEGSQRLRVRALVDGDTLGPVATDFQILVTVVDWLNRDDNTGTTRLEQTCTTRASGCGQVVSGSLWVSDCLLSSPFAADSVGVRITLDAEAGQVISLTGTASDWWFYMVVVDPTGTHIAVSDHAGEDHQAEILDLTLPVSGTYEVWVAGIFYSSAPNDYTVEIACQGPRSGSGLELPDHERRLPGALRGALE